MIPGPEVLEERLNALMNTKFPSAAGVDIINNDTWEAHRRALKIIREGRVSGNAV